MPGLSKSDKAERIELASGKATPDGKGRLFDVGNCLDVLLRTSPDLQLPSDDTKWLRSLVEVRFKQRFIQPIDPGIDMTVPQIDPWKFFESLNRAFTDYCNALQEPASPLWKACRYKLLGGCRKAGWDGNDAANQPVDLAAYAV